MEVREPPPSQSKTPRSIKPPRYIFNENSNMSEIVTSITNGVPVESVNPSLYGNLYPYLQMKCRNLCRDRNYMALKFVEDAMNSIQDHFVQVEADMIKQEEKYREETRQLSPEEYQIRFAAKEEARKNALRFTDEEMEESVQFALNGQLDRIDTRIVPLLSAELRKRSRNCIKQENYSDASIYRNAAKSVNTLSNGLRYEELTAAHIEELENRVIAASEDLDQLKLYWKQKIENAKAQKEADLIELRNEQVKKINEFDKIQRLQQKQISKKQHQNSNKSQNLKYSRNAKYEKERTRSTTKNPKETDTSTQSKSDNASQTAPEVTDDKMSNASNFNTKSNKNSNSNNDDLEDIPPQYCRYSNKVTELKKKEASLVSSKRFLEAIEARKEVEKQIQLEKLAFRKHYKDDIAIKKAEFIKKMQNKINVREQDAEAEMNLLIREMQRQITQQQKTLHRYELQWQQAEELNACSKNCQTAQNSASVSRRGGFDDGDDNDNFNNSQRGTGAKSSRDKDRMAEEIFRQRRAINAILYTRPQSARLPKIDKKY